VEERIRQELTATLMQGDAVEKLDAVVQDVLQAAGTGQRGYAQRIGEILEQGRLATGDETVVVTGHADLLPLMNPQPDAGLLVLEQRMALSGVSAIGGIIAAKIVSKVAAKGAIKMAATGMSKIAATKLAAGPAGAALGAAVGSLVPVAGTLVGSAIGFTLGVALGISVDALLLELEELYSRAEFRDQILAAIDDQEAAFDALLTGVDVSEVPGGGQPQ
jgi:phage tail tape-measure protein